MRNAKGPGGEAGPPRPSPGAAGTAPAACSPGPLGVPESGPEPGGLHSIPTSHCN